MGVCGIPRNSIALAPGSHLCWTASWTAAAEKVVSQKLIPGVLPHIKLAFVGIGKVLGSTRSPIALHFPMACSYL